MNIKVWINGAARDVAPGTTVAALLGVLKLNPRLVAVECNRELVPRAAHDRAELRDGDRLEIVTLVGGG